MPVGSVLGPGQLGLDVARRCFEGLVSCVEVNLWVLQVQVSLYEPVQEI